jgi:hypothetical protein
MLEHELVGAIERLEHEADGRALTSEEREQWNTLNEQIDERRVRRERVRELAARPGARISGVTTSAARIERCRESSAPLTLQ